VGTIAICFLRLLVQASGKAYSMTVKVQPPVSRVRCPSLSIVLSFPNAFHLKIKILTPTFCHVSRWRVT
jgi:hypothetical protein